ncbi:metal-dependent phosphohydrolase [Pseudomaricurvus alkylphenolicus]|uniref:heme biosynthesis HemY N-terminal domain-containing protein n=1 Tax=Pseudomaricurvus alkylphenolicus TaxID=1306991 RepID=UPI0014226D20|nr:metal-dependent phosphohydrolase [Pseudomaricurvus alkylphenolicus]
MKWLFFALVLALFGGNVLYQWMLNQPSYLLIVIGHHSWETSVWFALIMLALTVFLIWFGLWLLRGGFRGIGNQLQKVFVGAEVRGQRQTAAGLIYFIEGNWRQALRLLTRSAPVSSAPLVNYLGAARSAYELGDEQQANSMLAKAEEENPNAGLAVALTQARMQLLAKKYEQCAATLERARKLSPKHPVVLDLLRQVLEQLQDWQGLEKILPQLKRQNVVDEHELERLSRLVYIRQLQQAGQQDFSADAIESAWQKVPKNWRQSPEVVLIYVKLLEAEKAAINAESTLRKVLQKQWNSQLVLYYGLLKGADVQRQLLTAEGWLKERPGNAELLLTLGRLCMRNQLWGKARDYFESSLKIQGSPEAFAEMARLLAHLGEHKRSTEYYQQGLLLTADHLPDLPMPEVRNG